MSENNIHDITSFEKGEGTDSILDNEIEDGIGGTFPLEVRPFFKSSIIRFGIVIVAVTVVKTAGRIIVARNNAKYGT
jgi:hypothetical protein